MKTKRQSMLAESEDENFLTFSVTSDDTETDDLTIKIDVVKLFETLEGASLGISTQASPLSIDNFTSTSNALPEYTKDKTINIDIADTLPYTYDIIACRFSNNTKGIPPMNIDSWKKIFDLTTPSEYLVTPSGQLYIFAPGTEPLTIKVSGDPGEESNFLKYSLLFSVTYSDKDHFFQIDPFMKIRSNHL